MSTLTAHRAFSFYQAQRNTTRRHRYSSSNGYEGSYFNQVVERLAKRFRVSIPEARALVVEGYAAHHGLTISAAERHFEGARAKRELTYQLKEFSQAVHKAYWASWAREMKQESIPGI